MKTKKILPGVLWNKSTIFAFKDHYNIATLNKLTDY